MAESTGETGPSSLWDQICEEYELEQPTLPAGFKSRGKSITSEKDNQDLNAVESGTYTTDDTFVSDHKTCSPRKYLECYIFPVLLPGMAEMLTEAKKEKCFGRKRTKFIACDFLTQWLYNLNPKRKDHQFTGFFEIPFVQEWLKDHPRPRMPLSLLLSEVEAAITIQSFWRAYRSRCVPEVQELRQWQKELRETKDINKKVQEFWAKQESTVERELKDLEDRGTVPHSRTVSINVPSPTSQNTVI
ncbi:hypothetical protein FKM82_002745 [Ascaphus truei]